METKKSIISDLDMPQSNLPRNVFVYDNNVSVGNSAILVAGYFQFGRTTNGEFYDNLEICFREPRQSEFRLLNNNGIILPRDENIVPIGNYFVVSASCLPKRGFPDI